MEGSVDHEKHVRALNQWLNDTMEARELSERDRDYRNGYQWTDEEKAKLASRKQAPVTDNRIKPKVEGLRGLLIQRQTDPKAYPRTKKDEQGAHAVTDALRYVAEQTDLDDIELDVADNLFVEGYGAAVIESNDDGDIDITHVPWDRFYYDVHSRRPDFKDARCMGVITWMFSDDAKKQFPDAEDVIDSAKEVQTLGGETFDDRPFWVNSEDDRILVAWEFYLEDGVWMNCHYCVSGFLSEPTESEYLDEKGDPECPIEAVSAYVDRDNQRFGEVRGLIDLQDEINHRRSKALHILNTRQTAARKGAIMDVQNMKSELKKPDGHIEYEGERGDWEILENGDMADGQFKLLQQSQEQMNQTSFNSQLAGEQVGDQSGRAISLLQQGGMLETLPLYHKILNWKRRVYRQIWHRIKQGWTGEKWIRVTDNFDSLRWVGLNVPIPLSQYLQETVEDEAKPQAERIGALQMLQTLKQSQDPRLNEMVTVQNPIPELDMDIIVENAPESINTQQEQLQQLLQLAASRPEVPFTALLKLTQIREKDELIEEIRKREAQLAQQQQAQAQAQQALQAEAQNIEKAKVQSKLNLEAAQTGKVNMEAINQQLENLLIQLNPERVTSIST